MSTASGTGSQAERTLTAAVTPWWRWLFIVPGLAAVTFGGYGLWTHDRVPLAPWAKWFIGSALAHDLVIAPVWIGLGWLAAKVLPEPARGPAVVGAAVSGALALIATPLVLGFGDRPDNPSFAPRNYGITLVVVVAVVLGVSALVATVRVARANRRQESRDSA